MAPNRPFRAAKITDGCFAAVIRAFIASPKFRGYSSATREVWGRELRLAERPDTLGALSVNIIRPALVQAFMDGMADRPGKQAAALAALRQVERWAIVRDLLPQPITIGVEIGRSHDGHRPWSDEQVRLAEAHARPELAKAVTLGVNTGQRGSDLVKMRWSDFETYNGRLGINVVQVKTGRQIFIIRHR
jgi:integrase